jgi:ABC-type nitrate/sulfonate/bicarbonate transport system ATPase subunit/ABC-type transporter Mla maintaining outer membrane lipid asymmetry permease subunit MlaE
VTAANSLTVTGLTIRTPAGVLLVENASFEVAHRELVLLIGPSGSGKTSIINALCGLLGGREGAWQTAGLVEYGSRRIDLATMCSDLCGLVFQGNALFDDLSAGENLRIAADHAPSTGHNHVPVLSLLADVHPDKMIAACSGGQKQRIAIARTLVADHPVLVLDEPNSGLDIKSSRRLAGLIKKICTERSVPVIIAAHHVDDILPLADKVFLVDSTTRSILRVAPDMAAIETELMRLDAGSGDTPTTSANADRWMKRIRPGWSVRWFGRYFAEYFWVLCASPFMLAYIGLGGIILGFVSIWFGFNYHAFGGYLKSILHDETLAGIGFVQTTISVPLIASILVIARNSAVISADLGNRQLSSQFRAMGNLNIPGLGYLVASILIANTLSLSLLTVAALATASWSALQTWRFLFPDQPFEFWQENYFRRLIETSPSLFFELFWVTCKIVFSSILGSAAAVIIGLRPKTSVVSINNAIAQAIVIGVSMTLLVHALFAILQFWR